MYFVSVELLLFFITMHVYLRNQGTYMLNTITVLPQGSCSWSLARQLHNFLSQIDANIKNVCKGQC